MPIDLTTRRLDMATTYIDLREALLILSVFLWMLNRL